MTSDIKTPLFPPRDRDLVDAIAFHEIHNADFPAFVFSKDGTQDATEITYGQFAKAARRVPPLLDIEVPASTRPVVALIAQADTLVYKAVELGLMIGGLIPFAISPRNTAAAVINLLVKTDCHYILTTNGTLKELMDSVEAELKETHPNHKLLIKEIPSIADVFPELSDDSKSGKPDILADYPSPSQRPAFDDIAIYLHSSGSTGLPKAIAKTHRQLEHIVAFPSFLEFKKWSPHARMLGVQLPPFHAMGWCIQLILPLYLCTTVAIFPPVVTAPHLLPMAPTPDSILDHTERTRSSCALTIPAFLQIWAQDKRAIEILAKMDYVSFGGGGLSPQAGTILRENGVRLHCSYGGTEFGAIATSSLRPGDEDDWEYIEFADICTPRWIPQGDGTYELQFLTNPRHSLSVENLPDVRGYGTSDLFKPHPTKPGFWKIVGRVDDVIIHSSGEKTVPAPMEALMASSPQIMGAVMFGQGYDQPGVLIEPMPAYEIDASDPKQVAKFRNLVWPTVEKANQVAPSYSKVFKEMILVADKTKPLARAGKGTVLKKAALALYHDEIEALYEAMASVDSVEHIDPPETWDHEGVAAWLLEHAHDLTNGKDIKASETLFEQGLDSLGATILRRRIASALQTLDSDAGKLALTSVTQTLIYNYPSINALSSRILQLLAGPDAGEPSKTQVELIEEMISKYEFSGEIVNAGNRKEDGLVVILTGSTGYLGSQVLEGLLKDPRVTKIYALNRPGRDGDSVSGRHTKRFVEKGLDATLLSLSKLIFLETDSAAENLGLDEATYDELSASVNVIVHIAWRLDFNLSLASFESNIRGTHNLIKLARSGGHAEDVKFVFTSSVGVAQAWSPESGPYPDDVLVESTYAAGSGYGESKYVIERILASSGINATTVRLGQITGGRENGAWATSDWVPILVKSSIALGALPTAKGTITWSSTDGVAGSILDVVFYSGKYPAAMNLVHHNPVEFNTTITHIKEALEKERGISLPFIPFREWMDRLGKVSGSTSSEEMNRIPAIKLYGFFQALAQGDLNLTASQTEAFGTVEFATNKLKSVSKTYAEMPPLSTEHAYSWIRYWASAGLFD